jgi:hypothetical protein
MATLELDYMEYASDVDAQSAYTSSLSFSATGGNITTVSGDRIHTFLSNGTFTVIGNGNVDVLVIGGGGSGGNRYGGGGGAGGVIYETNYSIPSGTYSVTVGNGGTATGNTERGNNGENSVFDTLTAIGGGGGAGPAVAGGGKDGGSGGGGSYNSSYPGGSGSQGGDGGTTPVSTFIGSGGGGGGGNGGNSSGTVAGTGGIGITSSISGTPTDYAGGGGGCTYGAGSGGSASYGGGAGGIGVQGTAGTTNTGGGGGASGGESSGVIGGSGIIIVRYSLNNTNLSSYSEADIKTQGSYSLKCFALQSTSLNETLTKTFATHSDLTGVGYLRFDLRSTRTGSNIKFAIHDTSGTTTEITPNVLVANVFQEVIWNITGVADADKNDIDKIIITVINADADNTFYLDYFAIHSGGGMSQVKVSQLAQAGSLADTDLLLLSQNVGGGSYASKAVPYSVIRGTTGSYTTTFTNSSLVANILTVTHSLNDMHALSVIIENNSGKMLGPPDDIVYVDANSLTIDFTSLAPLTGTWYLRVSRGSGVASSVDMGQAWALNG